MDGIFSTSTYFSESINYKTNKKRKSSCNFGKIKAFSKSSQSNLHITNIYGSNNHHIIESCFKSFARSVRMSVEINKKIKKKIPSSKGML